MRTSANNIILTGFMGTGKTTVGRLLAAYLGYTFIDTDVLIESESGRTIPEIFAQDGEAAFRSWEQKISNQVATQSKQIVATGGRLMLDDHNAAVLGATGTVFCLSASPDEILARVLSDPKGTERPLLQGVNPAGRIQTLLSERAAGYGQFTQIQTDRRRPHEVVRQIIQQLDLPPDPPRPYLALDLGEKRIGVAVTDRLRITAQPLQTISRTSRKADFATIGEIVRTQDACRIIVGLPISLDGGEGALARWAQDYGTALATAINIPVTFWDESFTSEMAADAMRAQGYSRKQMKDKLDAVAAALICQSFLEAQRETMIDPLNETL